MKITHACPKCQSQRLWVIEEVRHAIPSTGHGSLPMPVTTGVIPDRRGFWDLSMTGAQYVEAGTFEAWVCYQCGFTEWYAKDVNEKLTKLAQEPGAAVRLVDATSPRGPFR
jgi:predicted nucleic-acid-binding Zn-ribbon protein